jgi:hypothetical protein
MPSVGFEPTIPVNAQPHTYAVDSAVTGIDATLIFHVAAHFVIADGEKIFRNVVI